MTEKIRKAPRSAAIILTIAFLSVQQAWCQQAWALHKISDQAKGCDGVRLADANGDGLADVAVGWEGGGISTIHFHPGYGASKQKWPSVVVGKAPSVEDAVMCDLDNDGALDVVSSCEGSSRTIFVHWAPNDKLSYMKPESWETKAIAASAGNMQWMFSVPIQLDGKNGLDIVAAGRAKDSELGWFEAADNARSLADWKWHRIGPCGWAMSIIASDMDGDGDKDIVVSDRGASAVRWFVNPGSGEAQKQEWEMVTVGSKGYTMFMKLGDVDGDGLEDAVLIGGTGDSKMVVFFKRLDKSGKKWSRTNIPLPSGAAASKGVAIGDIDSDNQNDIVAVMSETGEVIAAWAEYSGDPTNAESWKWHFISGKLPDRVKQDRVELIDIDGDGDLDVMTTNEANQVPAHFGVIWYENPINNGGADPVAIRAVLPDKVLKAARISAPRLPCVYTLTGRALPAAASLSSMLHIRDHKLQSGIAAPFISEKQSTRRSF